MPAQHHYTLTVQWTGNNGTGTSAYDAYGRNHIISIDNKSDIAGSADAPFLGDVTRHNPEDFLVASLSTCHMLWYLHLCADAGIIVTAYTDRASGTLVIPETGSGRFSEVTLNPIVTITDATLVDKANQLHDKANERCFMANSVNFPVHHKPVCRVAE